MTEISQTNPGQFQLLQIDKGNGVAVKERQILSVDVKDVIGGLLNVQRFQVGARVHQPRENEVVGRNELLKFIK